MRFDYEKVDSAMMVNKIDNFKKSHSKSIQACMIGKSTGERSTIK